MKSLQKIIPVFAFIFLIGTSTAFADTNTQNGLAVKGHDVVSYFTLKSGQNAVKGNPSIKSGYKGATYYFSSAANKQSFDKNPARYIPAYGGYCAFGVAHGQKVDVDPNAWAIHNGTLYLNVNKNIQGQWNKDRTGFIRKADEFWKDLI